MKYNPIEKLPTERAFLHFEATRLTPSEIQVDYELVIPLRETDCCGTFDHRGRKSRPRSHRSIWLDSQNNRRFPLGRTMVGTERKDYPFASHPVMAGEIELPFRDGAHQSWDNEKLGGLPVIYTMAGKHYALTPSAKT